MGATTFGDPVSTYWRRRFIVLVIGLMALSLAAWGLSDSLAVGTGLVTRSTHGQHSARPTPAPAPSPSATS